MTSSVCRFYIVNQLLCGVGFDKLVPQAQKELERFALKERYDSLLAVQCVQLDKMQATLLNFLRMQQYDYCLSAANHRVLTLRDVVRLVRTKDVSPESVEQWAAACFRNVKEISKGTPYVQDGTVYTTAEYLRQEYDLDGQMKRMFALYCWGTDDTATPELKEFVRGWSELTTPGKDTMCSSAWLTRQFELLSAPGVSPRTIATTALVVSDLNPVLAVSGVPAQYSNPAAESVIMMVPTKSANKVVCAEMAEADFVKLAGLDGRGLANAFVRAGQLVIGGAADAADGA